MKIDNKNGNIINTPSISMHDSVIFNFHYNRMDKKISLELEDEWNNYEIYITRFNNVIGFEMTSCDYWGRSPHIFDFEYMEENERTLIPKLFEKGRTFENGLLDLKKEDEYIEVLITFTSGDTLRIACEYLEYLKEDKK